MRPRPRRQEGDLRPLISAQIEWEDFLPLQIGNHAPRFQHNRRGGCDVPQFSVHRHRAMRHARRHGYRFQRG